MEGLSLRPSDAQQGGFLDDADVTLKALRFVTWDYQGKAPVSVALKVDMEDDAGATHEQYYSAGDPSKMQPSPDGKAIVPMAGATGLNVNTNCIAFISSLVNAGFPEDKILNDISIFEGMYAHVNQVAQPKRPGIKAREGERADKTYLLVTKINRMPWEKVAAKPAAGAPVARPTPGPRPVAAPAAAPPAAAPSAPVAAASGNGDALTAKARATVVGILAEKGGAVPKSSLPTEAFRALSNDPDRNAIVTLVFQDGFIAAAVAEGAFAFDGTNVLLG